MTDINAAVEFGPFRLAIGQRQLMESGKPVAIGSRALEILILLVERAGELVTKEDIIARVWPTTFVEDANLRVHVAALRRVLGDGRDGRRYLTNTPGRGYAFVCPVTRPQGAGLASIGPNASSMVPAPLSPVRGREGTIDTLKKRLLHSRFVTIVGPGGIGKTTVALSLAAAVAASYRDGAHFIDLAPVVNPASVPSALANALSAPIRSKTPIPELLGLIKDKQMLLVFDSCEHVLTAAAELIEAIVREAPGVSLLVTSREPVRAQTEHVYRLQPLDTPPPGIPIDAATALSYPAVQVFVDRAAESTGEFALSDEDAPLVADICRRLDGVALAIELAAGRLSAFGVRVLAEQLENRFKLLTRGRRTALPRHQTLLATLDWSYELLTVHERAVLRRLAIFTGSFSLEIAAPLSASDDITERDVVENVADLVAKSLITADTSGETVRYRLLETTRAYALQKLTEHGEREHYFRRYAKLLSDMFEAADLELEKLSDRQWIAKYAHHIDDVRATLDWSFTAGGDGALGVRLTIAASALWQRLSLLEEFCGRIERVVPTLKDGTTGSLDTDMKLYGILATALPVRGPGQAATAAAYAKALALAEQAGNIDYQLRALRGLWSGFLNNDELAPHQAPAMAQRFAKAARQSQNAADRLIGDRIIGFTLHLQGHHAEARTYIERMLASYDPLKRNLHIIRYQYDQRVTAHTTMAIINWLQGYPERAEASATAAVEEAIAAAHPESICYALTQAACPIALMNDNRPRAGHFIAMLIDTAQRYGQHIWLRWGRCFEGMLMVRNNQPEGVAAFAAAVAALPLYGPRMRFGVSITQIAELLGLIGRHEDALEIVTRALEDNGGSERWNTAELLRIKGDNLIAARGTAAHEKAEQSYDRALAIAHAHGALAWELRALSSLARLHDIRGDGAAARALLRDVYVKFSEGHATADMQAARTLAGVAA